MLSYGDFYKEIESKIVIFREYGIFVYKDLFLKQIYDTAHSNFMAIS